MTSPRLWIAWLLVLVFGFTAPAQAMRAVAGLGTPLRAESHGCDYPINNTDPSGLDILASGDQKSIDSFLTKMGSETGYKLGIENGNIYIIESTGGKYNSAARTVLHQALKHDKTIPIHFVWDEGAILAGADKNSSPYGKHVIDMSDIEKVSALPYSVDFGSAWMLHETAEALSEAKGAPFRRSKGVGGAHGDGINAENEYFRASGSKLRRALGPGPDIDSRGDYIFDYGEKIRIPKKMTLPNHPI